MRVSRRPPETDAELDITAFMNLMIVLVPVLLLSMVFSHITVLEIQLPPSVTQASEAEAETKRLELILRKEAMQLNYPAGVALKRFEASQSGHDFEALQSYLKRLKQTLANKGIDKRAITLLSEPAVRYQTMVSAMDAVRSYEAVVAASPVEAELFPDIAFGEAPSAEEASP